MTKKNTKTMFCGTFIHCFQCDKSTWKYKFCFNCFNEAEVGTFRSFIKTEWKRWKKIIMKKNYSINIYCFCMRIAKKKQLIIAHIVWVVTGQWVIVLNQFKWVKNDGQKMMEWKNRNRKIKLMMMTKCASYLGKKN